MLNAVLCGQEAWRAAGGWMGEQTEEEVTAAERKGGCVDPQQNQAEQHAHGQRRRAGVFAAAEGGGRCVVAGQLGGSVVLDGVMRG